MPKAPTHSHELRRTASSTPAVDKYAMVTIFAFAYATIIGPLISFSAGPHLVITNIQNAEPNLVNRIFLPVMATLSVALAVRNYSRLGKWPPHLKCLLAYVALAGVSVLWAFRPEASFVRFVQQLMLLSSIVLPAILAARTADLMRGMFLCFAIGAIINFFLVFDNSLWVDDCRPPISCPVYAGYLMHKNALGEFSAAALLLALHETLYPGLRRAFGAIIAVIAALLLVWSRCKTGFALALVCPLLAGVLLMVSKATRTSLGILLLLVLFCYIVLSEVSSFNIFRISTLVYGDPTLSGRIFIWDFALSEIARRPMLGWGYLSFWLVGSDAPSIVEASGWIRGMPNAHNGYYDTILELGYVGCSLLIVFILATLHAIGRVVDCDRGRAWFVLAVALYIILYGFLESFWMRGAEVLWVSFVFLAVDIGRYWKPLTKAAYGSKTLKARNLGPHHASGRRGREFQRSRPVQQ